MIRENENGVYSHSFFLNSLNDLDIILHKIVLYNYYAQLVLVCYVLFDTKIVCKVCMTACF